MSQCGGQEKGVFKENNKFLDDEYVIDALGLIAADFNGDKQNDLYICDRFNPQANNKDILFLKEK